MKNPFVTKGYAGPEYFCDRVQETVDLVKLLTNDNNMALISPRRLGKTDLIHHCFAQPEIKEKYYTFIIDIYATSSLADFVSLLGQAILDELKPRGRKTWEKFVGTLKSIQQQISFDMNGNPVWGVGLGAYTNPAITLDEIFVYLKTADISEDNRVSRRSKCRSCTENTYPKMPKCYIFFLSPSRPFYQSVITMGLSPIPIEKYKEFACAQFEKCGKSIQPDVVDIVYQRFDGITSYLQRLMNVLFLNTAQGETCSKDMIDVAINYILDLYTEYYDTLLAQMSEKQRNVFLAIACERRVKSVSGGAFVRKYHLQSPSSVMSALRGLLDKDLITQENGEYFVYDLFFQLWIERK